MLCCVVLCCVVLCCDSYILLFPTDNIRTIKRLHWAYSAKFTVRQVVALPLLSFESYNNLFKILCNKKCYCFQERKKKGL